MITETRARKYVREAFESMDDHSLIAIHNEHCREVGSEDEIHDNDDEFFDMMFSKTLEAVRAICYGEYRYTDDYVQFNGYGNLESTSNPLDFIDIDELVNVTVDNFLTEFGEIEKSDLVDTFCNISQDLYEAIEALEE